MRRVASVSLTIPLAVPALPRFSCVGPLRDNADADLSDFLAWLL